MAEEKVKDIARKAEEVISNLERDKEGKIKLTKSQIRKFLTAVNALTNKVDVYRIQHEGTEILSAELASEVKYLKVKLAYQAGRNPKTVKPFVEAAKLNKWIDGIGTDIRAYEDFAHYVEALVAYHKFYGGRD